MSENTIKYSVTGSTLVELLILMIITGIIFIGVFEGFMLFDRMRRNITGRIVENMSLIGNYEALGHMFSVSDSIRRDSDTLRLFRYGGIWRNILIGDSLLLCSEKSGAGDTLMKNITSHELIFNTLNPASVDSLILSFGNRRMGFGIRRDPSLSMEQESMDREREYRKNKEDEL